MFARIRSLLTLVVALVVVWPAWRAQTESIEPMWVVVEAEPGTLRCEAAAEWYRVALAPQGSVLLADGRSGRYLRVSYPNGSVAAVSADETQATGHEAFVELTAPSTLRAYNLDNPTNHFRDLLPPGAPLPASTFLRVREESRNAGGTLAYYVIDAPEQARGFILESQTRPARADEIPQQEDEGEEEEGEGGEGIVGGTEDVIEQIENAGEGDGTGTGPDPALDGSVDDAATDEPQNEEVGGEGTDVEAEATLPEAERALIARVAGLNRLFDRVMASPGEDAEFRALAREYTALADGAVPDGAEGWWAGVRSNLVARAELLNLRADVQDSRRRLEALTERAAAASGQAAQATAARADDFAIVGRLAASGIYTGDSEGLPLLYRVQASDSALGTTLAYVRPPTGERLDHLLGRTVGVDVSAAPVGDGRVPVVEASRVTPLDALPGDAPGATNGGGGGR